MAVFESSSLVTATATLVGAIIGATASIASTYWLHNKQVKGEEQRLRQALIAEVDSMEVNALSRVSEQLQGLGTREERKDDIEGEVQRVFEKAGDKDEFDEIPDEVMDGISDWGAQMFAQGPANTLEELSTIDLSTDVYDANLDKIGRLDVADIEEIIEYYKRIHKVQQTVESITQALESREQEADVSQFGGRLKSQAQGLASQKDRVLDVLHEEKKEEEPIPSRLFSVWSDVRNRTLQFARDKTTIVDFTSLFLFPTAILLAIFLYPESESILEYKARNPTLRGIIGSTFAHRSWVHLTGNLIGFWLIGGTGYILSRKIGQRNLFRASFASYISILPFFANYFIQIMLSNQPEIHSQLESVGFSIVVASFTAFLALCLPMYIDRATDSDERVLALSFGLFFGGFGIIFSRMGFPILATGLAVAIGVVSFFYLLNLVSKELDERLWSIEYVWCIWAIAIFIWSVSLLFNPSVGGGYFGHMAGYWGGFLIPVAGVLSWRSYKLSPAYGILSDLRD